MKMLRGFWLDIKTNKWIEVVTHEITIHEESAQNKLGLTQNKITAIDRIQGDADKVRFAAVKMGFIRIRDYSDSLHVQFYASHKLEGAYLRAVKKMILQDRRSKGRKNGLSLAWDIALENLKGHRGIKLPMNEFLRKTGSGAKQKSNAES